MSNNNDLSMQHFLRVGEFVSELHHSKNDEQSVKR